MNGIGSDAFAILWDGEKLHGLNASGRSPQAWTPQHFSKYDSMPTGGWDVVTVSGCVSAWMVLSQRFGRLPFADLFEPAIRYAQDGWLVPPVTATSWALAERSYPDMPDWHAAFRRDGRVPAVGERFHSWSRRVLWNEFPRRRARRSTGETWRRRSSPTQRRRGADDSRRPGVAPPGMGAPSGDRLPWPEPARDPTQRPGNYGAHRTGYPAAVRSGGACRRLGGQPAPADRGDETGFRRRAPIRLRSRHAGHRVRSPARRCLSAATGGRHRHDAGSGANFRYTRTGRNRLPGGGRRKRAG